MAATAIIGTLAASSAVGLIGGIKALTQKPLKPPPPPQPAKAPDIMALRKKNAALSMGLQASQAAGRSSLLDSSSNSTNTLLGG